MFRNIKEHHDFIENSIRIAAANVYDKLGPGMLKIVYEVCMEYELGNMQLEVKRHIEVPVAYGGIQFVEGFIIDLQIEKVVICIIKADDFFNPVWEKQVWNQLRLLKLDLGFLINFNVIDIEKGIKKVVYDWSEMVQEPQG